MAVPVDEKPPVIMCGREPHRLKACLGRCEHYEDVYDEDNEDVYEDEEDPDKDVLEDWEHPREEE